MLLLRSHQRRGRRLPVVISQGLTAASCRENIKKSQLIFPSTEGNKTLLCRLRCKWDGGFPNHVNNTLHRCLQNFFFIQRVIICLLVVFSSLWWGLIRWVYWARSDLVSILGKSPSVINWQHRLKIQVGLILHSQRWTRSLKRSFSFLTRQEPPTSGFLQSLSHDTWLEILGISASFNNSYNSYLDLLTYKTHHLSSQRTASWTRGRS